MWSAYCIMSPREIYRNKIELLKGTLDMLVLETLRWGAQHGHAISQAILRNEIIYRELDKVESQQASADTESQPSRQ